MITCKIHAYVVNCIETHSSYVIDHSQSRSWYELLTQTRYRNRVTCACFCIWILRSVISRAESPFHWSAIWLWLFCHWIVIIRQSIKQCSIRKSYVSTMIRREPLDRKLVSFYILNRNSSRFIIMVPLTGNSAVVKLLNLSPRAGIKITVIYYFLLLNDASGEYGAGGVPMLRSLLTSFPTFFFFFFSVQVFAPSEWVE